jgi:hypothetical protein
MKSSTFWDITPCSPLKIIRCFGGTYRLNIQGRRTGQGEAGCYPPFSLVEVYRLFTGTYCLNLQRRTVSQTTSEGFASLSYFYPEDGGTMFSETSVNFNPTTRRYISEDNTRLHVMAAFVTYVDHYHGMLYSFAASTYI